MGKLYEDRLERLWVDVSRIYGAHEPHVIPVPPQRRTVPHEPCSNCGHVPPIPDTEKPTRCGGDFSNNRCDALGNAIWKQVDLFFPADRELCRALLDDTPEAWVWGTDGGGAEDLAGYVRDLFRADASQRLGLDRGYRDPRDESCVPVSPASTRYAAELQALDGACPDDPDGLHHVGCGCDVDHFDNP